LKRTYGMHNVCNVRLPQAMGTSFRASVSVSVQLWPVVLGIGYRALARYRSNPRHDVLCVDAEMFGVSDHDLMFAVQASKAVEGDAESDDENNVRFIQDKVQRLLLISF